MKQTSHAGRLAFACRPLRSESCGRFCCRRWFVSQGICGEMARPETGASEFWQSCKSMNDIIWNRHGVVFVCDRRKRLANITKHKVDFFTASEVFFDPFAISLFDAGHSIDEERWIIVGKIDNEILLLVAYADRNNILRLISARKASRKEERLYAGQ